MLLDVGVPARPAVLPARAGGHAVDRPDGQAGDGAADAEVEPDALEVAQRVRGGADESRAVRQRAAGVR
ncbi:hypothetical protein ACFSVJ_10205 [Prauserella oleivorans]